MPYYDRNEQVSESSQYRKLQLGSATFANKPDFRVVKVQGSKRIELVFGEFSKLDAKEPKHKEDWKKLVRFGKDSFDNPVKGCLDIPYILLLGINEQIKVSIIDSFNGVVHSIKLMTYLN